MGRFIQVIGGLWAALGFYSCISAANTTSGQDAAVTGFATMFAMLLFIVPGLLLFGVGTMMIRRKSARADEVATAVQAALAAERAKSQQP